MTWREKSTGSRKEITKCYQSFSLLLCLLSCILALIKRAHLIIMYNLLGHINNHFDVYVSQSSTRYFSLDCVLSVGVNWVILLCSLLLRPSLKAYQTQATVFWDQEHDMYSLIVVSYGGWIRLEIAQPVLAIHKYHDWCISSFVEGISNDISIHVVVLGSVQPLPPPPSLPPPHPKAAIDLLEYWLVIVRSFQAYLSWIHSYSITYNLRLYHFLLEKSWSGVSLS